MAERIKNIITGKLTVMWSNLIKPDSHFGESTANHNITVVLTDELEATLNAVAKEQGVKKINGIMTKDDGTKTIKVKSKTHVDKGAFPCQDASAQWTTSVPFGGDVVRLKLAPVVLSKPSKSISFYLNGVQIVEKNSADLGQKTNGFDAVDGGFVGEAAAAPVNKTEAPEAQPAVGITDEEIPF